MKTWIKIAGAALLVAMSHTAFAFQEQAPLDGGKPKAEVQAPAVPVAPGLESAITRPAAQGTPVKIPGLGTIGVLPRVDFGLDLLYGQADGKAVAPRDVDRSIQDDGVAIRGSVKHRF